MPENSIWALSFILYQLFRSCLIYLKEMEVAWNDVKVDTIQKELSNHLRHQNIQKRYHYACSHQNKKYSKRSHSSVNIQAGSWTVWSEAEGQFSCGGDTCRSLILCSRCKNVRGPMRFHSRQLSGERVYTTHQRIDSGRSQVKRKALTLTYVRGPICSHINESLRTNLPYGFVYELEVQWDSRNVLNWA